jgi:molybdopterin-guanine dinucleotide biosynthesis protein A
MIPFTGAVLTGGRSTRMGRDKASLVVDGTPMGLRVIEALRAAGAAEVFAVGGAGVGDVRVVPDDGAPGPMAGVRAALAAARHDAVVVLACDLPDVSPDGVRAVVDALVADDGALVAVPVVNGQLEPLHAAWRRAALAAIDPDEPAVHRVIAGLPHIEVAGLDPAWLRNVNEPGDLAR